MMDAYVGCGCLCCEEWFLCGCVFVGLGVLSLDLVLGCLLGFLRASNFLIALSESSFFFFSILEVFFCSNSLWSFAVSSDRVASVSVMYCCTSSRLALWVSSMVS